MGEVAQTTKSVIFNDTINFNTNTESDQAFVKAKEVVSSYLIFS